MNILIWSYWVHHVSLRQLVMQVMLCPKNIWIRHCQLYFFNSHIILPKSPLRHWQEERYPQILVHPFFFFILVFFHDHSRITGLQGKRGGIFLTPHYHFHPFHRHFDISRAITAESSLLHIASSRNRTGNL